MQEELFTLGEATTQIEKHLAAMNLLNDELKVLLTQTEENVKLVLKNQEEGFNRIAQRAYPLLSEDFFKGQQFVLTTSLEQASVGEANFDRVANFAGEIVKLDVRGNRLFLIVDAEGKYEGSQGSEIVLASYPVTILESEGKKWYRADFF